MIKESAIQRNSDGRVWTGRRHSNVYSKMVKEGHIKNITRAGFTQGFVTTEGTFVDRKEAFKIAKDNGQIKAEPWAEPTLMSEDLY